MNKKDDFKFVVTPVIEDKVDQRDDNIGQINSVNIPETYNDIDRNNDDRTYKYLVLPEAYDIFVNINFGICKFRSDFQREMVSLFLENLRERLNKIYVESGILKVLPKLCLSQDTDGAIVIDWDYVNYRIFINIGEKIADSFYGIIVQNAANGTNSYTGELNKLNYEDVVYKLLQLVFAN